MSIATKCLNLHDFRGLSKISRPNNELDMPGRAELQPAPVVEELRGSGRGQKWPSIMDAYEQFQSDKSLRYAAECRRLARLARPPQQIPTGAELAAEWLQRAIRETSAWALAPWQAAQRPTLLAPSRIGGRQHQASRISLSS